MSYAILDVTIVDVEKGCVLPGQTVLIQGDRIVRIGAQGAVEIPQGAEVVLGQGLYLMPSLVDAHVHYFDAPIFGRLMVANGVLLVRDMGMPNEYILPLRDQLNRGEAFGPEMVAVGVILDGDPPMIPPISLGIKTPEDGRAGVRRQAEAGADMIKVYSRLGKDAFLAVLDESRKLGLKVVGHIPDAIYVEDAAAAGLSSCEHFFGFEKLVAKLLGEPVRFDFLGTGAEVDYFMRLSEVRPDDLELVYRRLRASGLSICPTVVISRVGTQFEAIKVGRFKGSEYTSPGLLSMWRLQWSSQGDLPDFIWKNWAQMVVGLNRAGVPLMVGTDLMVPGILPGISVHEEMAIWQEVGIPPAEVLRGATIVPAQFMGRGDHLGTICQGKTASMILVRANPLEDVRNAQQIEGVFLKGNYLNRQALDRLLDEAKELARGGDASPAD